MKDNRTGGPAFPQTHESWGGAGEAHPVPEGMSLHDWYAGMALMGLIISIPRMPNGDMARQAHGLADAMISECECNGVKEDS